MHDVRESNYCMRTAFCWQVFTVEILLVHRTVLDWTRWHVSCQIGLGGEWTTKLARLVTCMSCVETFVTGIKIESSDQSLFWEPIKGSRWPPNCGSRMCGCNLTFDPWKIKWSRVSEGNDQAYFLLIKKPDCGLVANAFKPNISEVASLGYRGHACMSLHRSNCCAAILIGKMDSFNWTCILAHRTPCASNDPTNSIPSLYRYIH